MATIETVAGPAGLGYAAGSIWVGSTGSEEVSRIDPETNEVTTVPIGKPTPAWLATSDDAVWVSNVRDNSVSRIDPATNAVVANVRVGTRVERCRPTASGRSTLAPRPSC